MDFGALWLWEGYSPRSALGHMPVFAVALAMEVHFEEVESPYLRYKVGAFA
jgi:hypothetical protein